MNASLANTFTAILYWMGAALILSGGILSLVAGRHPSNPKHAYVPPFSPTLRKYYSPTGQRYLRISRWAAFTGFAMFGCRAYFFLP